jgi:hypothetical protein
MPADQISYPRNVGDTIVSQDSAVSKISGDIIRATDYGFGTDKIGSTILRTDYNVQTFILPAATYLKLNLRSYVDSRGYDGVGEVIFVVSSGTWIYSDSISEPALTTGQFARGIVLRNYGTISGKGGDGGVVYWATSSGSSATVGGNGGVAVRTECRTEIKNYGIIAGGGGGGSGGFYRYNDPSTNDVPLGGGGGAGGGNGGGTGNGSIVTKAGGAGTNATFNGVGADGPPLHTSYPSTAGKGGGAGGGGGAGADYGRSFLTGGGGGGGGSTFPGVGGAGAVTGRYGSFGGTGGSGGAVGGNGSTASLTAGAGGGGGWGAMGGSGRVRNENYYATFSAASYAGAGGKSVDNVSSFGLTLSPVGTMYGAAF